jgi:hypothetical protein
MPEGALGSTGAGAVGVGVDLIGDFCQETLPLYPSQTKPPHLQLEPRDGC